MGDAIRLLEEGVLAATLPMLAVHVIGRASPIDPAAVRATAALGHDVVTELDVGHFAWLAQPGSVTHTVLALHR